MNRNIGLFLLRILACVALIPISIVSLGLILLLPPIVFVLAVLLVPIWGPLYFLNFKLADRIMDFFLMPLIIPLTIGTWSGTSLMYLFRGLTEVTEQGILIIKRRWKETKWLIAWQEIEAIESHFKAPFWLYGLRLKNGTLISMDLFLDRATKAELLNHAARHGIPIKGIPLNEIPTSAQSSRPIIAPPSE